MISTKFEYRNPGTVQEAIRMYEEYQGRALYLGGGTDLMPRVKLGLEKPKVVIDLKRIQTLASINDEGEWIRVGSLVRIFQLKQHKIVEEYFPALRESLEATSCETLQMRGTIGGNILQNTRCLFYNQSEFWRKSKGFCLKMGGGQCNAVSGAKKCFANYCSDNAVALSTLAAELEFSGPEGDRRIALDELYSNKSGAPFQNRPGEILTSVFITGKKTKGGYEKLRVRGSIDYPLLGVAISAWNGVARIAVGAIGPKPYLVETTPTAGDALTEAVNEILKHAIPVGNTVLDPDYRKRMIPVMARRLLNRVTEEGVE